MLAALQAGVPVRALCSIHTLSSLCAYQPRHLMIPSPLGLHTHLCLVWLLCSKSLRVVTPISQMRTSRLAEAGEVVSKAETAEFGGNTEAAQAHAPPSTHGRQSLPSSCLYRVLMALTGSGGRSPGRKTRVGQGAVAG